MKIVTYITFDGNAREALNFYKDALGGQLTQMPVAGSAIEEHMSHMPKDALIHGQLDLGNLTLMASDMTGPAGYVKGGNMMPMLMCESEELVHEKYAKLAEGGQSTMPPSPAFWGGVFGHLTDKFGIDWGIHWSEDLLKPDSAFKL